MDDQSTTPIPLERRLLIDSKQNVPRSTIHSDHRVTARYITSVAETSSKKMSCAIEIGAEKQHDFVVSKALTNSRNRL